MEFTEDTCRRLIQYPSSYKQVLKETGSFIILVQFSLMKTREKNTHSTSTF